MALLMTKIKIELDPDEYRCFSRYQSNHGIESLSQAVKEAALRSLPKKKRWRKEEE